MNRVQNCCGCFDLAVGSKLIGVLDIISSASTIFNSLLALSSDQKSMEHKNALQLDKEDMEILAFFESTPGSLIL
jgi:hypothetical protein